MAQGVNEKISVLPAIEAELHFVQVCGKMLRADLVPRSNDAAFQQRECGFHGVRVNVAVNVKPALCLIVLWRSVMAILFIAVG